MRIEAITTCVNYSDYLAYSLHENLQHVDHMVVVTSRKDKATQDLCHHYGVVCVDTEVFFEHGDSFNKGRAINVGLQYCRQKDSWLLHLDADIVLPHRFRNAVNAAALDQTCIYGADRLEVYGYEKWREILNKKEPQHTDGYLVSNPHGLETGYRLFHGDYGYCPIGFFQMWHSSENRQYPGSQSSSGTSEHTDVLFVMQWEREKRRLIPHLYVYHLQSEKTVMGVNWNGRKTPWFGPKKHPKDQCYKPHHHHCHCDKK